MKITITVDSDDAQALVNAWQIGRGDSVIIAKVRDLFDGKDGHLPILETALRVQS